MIMMKSQCGISAPSGPGLKIERNAPAAMPAKIIIPRKMNPMIAKNIVHFLVVFRCLMLSGLNSSRLVSVELSI